MEDKTLLKIALICALAGLLVLGIISNYAEPDFSSGKNGLGTNFVKINGIVNKVRYSKNSMTLDISEIKNSKAIIYNPKKFNLTEGTQVEIIGKSDDGIVAVDKIRVI